MLSLKDRLVFGLKIVISGLVAMAILLVSTDNYAQQYLRPTKNYVVLTDTVPCYLDIKLKGEIIAEPTEGDSVFLGNREIKKLTSKYYQSDSSILLVDYSHLLYYRVRLLFDNKSQLDTIELAGVADAVKLDFFKKKGKKLLPIKLDEPCGMQLAYPSIAPHKTDTSFYLALTTDLAKLDTGDYIVRGVYRQKCKNTVKVKHTNEVRFHLID